jgi:ribosomal protein L19
MLLKEIENLLKNKKDTWRDIKNYNVGEIIEVKYQYAGLGLKIRKFVGICICKRNKVLMSTLKLRNVINDKAIEFNFFLESPKILGVKKVEEKKMKVRKSKLYYLREKPLSRSTFKS